MKPTTWGMEYFGGIDRNRDVIRHHESLAMGTPQAACQEQLRRFVAEVMPAFTKHMS
jgi:hypothetical protein